MKIKNICLLALALFVSIKNIQAHALWLETSSVGVKGRAQQVKVYYGEYAEGLHEKVAGNFSGEMQQFSLWLVAPDNSKTQLTCTSDTDCFTAQFIPDQEGIYTLVLENKSMKIVDTKGNLGLLKPFFYGVTAVKIGRPGQKETADALNSGGIFIVKKDHADWKTGTPLSLAVLNQGKPLDNVSVTIFSPEGWIKEVPVDQKGEMQFKPEWKGRYVAEVVYFDKTPGESGGDKYQTSRNVSTCAFEVK